MREIVFKNSTTHNHRRRDLWIHETTDENGLHAEVQKRCIFLVKNYYRLPNPVAVEKWIHRHTETPQCRLRNLTVNREENTKTGAKHFFFKAIGSFYAVMGMEVFLIRFVQTYEVNLAGSTVNEGGGEWTS